MIGVLCECKRILKCNHVQSSECKKWKWLWWISLTVLLKPNTTSMYLMLICFIDECCVLISFAMYSLYRIAELFIIVELMSVNLCHISYVINTSYSKLCVSLPDILSDLTVANCHVFCISNMKLIMIYRMRNNWHLYITLDMPLLKLA